MPRLVKGAKWTYGWVVVGTGREIRIPPQAWDEYGFRAGDEWSVTKIASIWMWYPR